MDDADKREFMDGAEAVPGGAGTEGRVRISEDVVAQIAVKALSGVEGVKPASPGLMANLRLGRKTTNGVRITLSEGEFPEVQVDAYVAVRYGLRIPDVCWDVQEAIKEQVERYTGYAVRAVNVFVQGITFQEDQDDGGYDDAPSFVEEE
ncbi:protein of unknown function DUF322 [Thermanaerovibrio acidaminovorans DSM 6589]|uniref:Asp23/Gls24 family envelope stress response protein n=1 Tax=Thermanaerovibrio acidaminovorans (strain ATCC 49978 / DSM 6589 / Su883) TaxID=525903 RepID=D1B5I1_THEAS|nr:Asp23/Gls24 family envelope stress response protein [Thermanaerovibrio acidaminovorans]ACZ19272.1 protein of unknown function DUF322 [Thermanaerovibrio acidaminovorans DSM 6589]